MKLNQDSVIEQVVYQLMSRLERNSLQSQALFQAYCGVSLPGYPTMEEAGIIDGAGSFHVAGERVRLLQKEAVQRARAALVEIGNSNGSHREAIERASQDAFECDCFHSFFKKINDGTGQFLQDVSSSP